MKRVKHCLFARIGMRMRQLATKKKAIGVSLSMATTVCRKAPLCEEWFDRSRKVGKRAVYRRRRETWFCICWMIKYKDVVPPHTHTFNIMVVSCCISLFLTSATEMSHRRF